MKKIAFLFFLAIFQMAFSQVGINTNTPNSASDLTLGSTNKGLLLNRVELTATNSAAPLSAHVAGMAVYNTATAGTAPNNVTPGHYYNDGTKWVRTLTSTPDQTVDVTGLVGGLASPNPFTGASFSPNTPANTDYIYINKADGTLWVYNGTQYVTYIAPPTTEWYLSNTTNDAGANKVGSIYRTGNVGIGKAVPAKALDVVGDAQFLPNSVTAGNELLIDGYKQSISSVSGPRLFSSAPVTIQSNDEASGISLQARSTSAAENPAVRILSGTSAQSEVFRVNSTGKVGVLTNAPTETLDVNGNVRIRNLAPTTNSAQSLVLADTNGRLHRGAMLESALPQKEVLSVTVQPGETQTVTVASTAANFQIAMITIVSWNVCGKTMISSFSKAGNTICLLGAQARDVVGQYSILDSFGNNVRLVFPNTTGCVDGGSGIQFDFDMYVANQEIGITNRGNIAKTYTIRILNNI